MRRGDVVTIAQPGDFSKPRPAIIIQADRFETTGTVLVVPLTSTISDALILRLDLTPSAENGLRHPSQVMVDKITAVPRAKVGHVIGSVDDAVMLPIMRSIALLVGLAD